MRLLYFVAGIVLGVRLESWASRRVEQRQVQLNFDRARDTLQFDLMQQRREADLAQWPREPDHLDRYRAAHPRLRSLGLSPQQQRQRNKLRDKLGRRWVNV